MKETNNIINILIVDDLEDNLILMESLLENPELNIVSVTSGKDAIAKLREQDFAVVLLDVQMPGMDGFETAELISHDKQMSKVPIIFVTAISKEQKHIFKGYGVGAVDYMLKPVIPEILISKVKIFVDLYKQKQFIEEKRRESEELNALLCEKNNKINEQNELLQEKQLALQEVLKELEYNKRELEIKNKDFTDSVRYAKRIQRSIFPSQDLISYLFPDSFVFLQPKELLSGDFYWFEQYQPEGNTPPIAFAAAIDCTGHGVPGALLSVVGHNLLNQTVKKHHLTVPADIMNEINRELLSILNQAGNQTVRDGMDMALITYDKKKNELQYCGANVPLYWIRNDSLEVIKPDNYSLGYDEKRLYAMDNIDDAKNNADILRDNSSFANHKINVKRGDTFYIFSDGFADQFGGKKGKKFKYRRFRELLISTQANDMTIQKKRLSTEFNNWRGTHEQVDDVLIIGIRF